MSALRRRCVRATALAVGLLLGSAGEERRAGRGDQETLYSSSSRSGRMMMSSGLQQAGCTEEILPRARRWLCLF